MSVYELYVEDAASRWQAVRWELFLFPAVADVAPADDANHVRVIHEGEPEPERWRETLREKGVPGRPALDARVMEAWHVDRLPSCGDRRR